MIYAILLGHLLNMFVCKFVVAIKVLLIYNVYRVFVNMGGTAMDNKALYNIGYGLYVLTAQNNDKQNGCIINTVMQITSNPICLVIGVNKATLTHDMVMTSKKFNLSVLTEDAPFSVFQTFGYNFRTDA